MRHLHCQSRVSQSDHACRHTNTSLSNSNINRPCVFNNSSAFVLLYQQVLRGGQVFPKKQHDFVSNGLWGGPAEWKLWYTGSIVGAWWQQQSAPHFNYTRNGCSAALGKRQASVCLPAILFKTPLSVPKDSIVNVQLFAPPTPQHWAVTDFDVQLCLLSWALYCLYVLWNLFPVGFNFLLEMVHWRVCTVCFLCIYKLEHLFYEM